MAEEIAQELAATNTGSIHSAGQDMEVETAADPMDESAGSNEANGIANSKREREEGEGDEDDASKKLKVEKSVEEERLEKEETVGVKLWAKEFGSSVEMFDYFFKIIRAWPINVDVNRYEHMMLLELLKKGHSDPEKKIKSGVRAFQIRFHPEYKSKCFFILREDDTVDDFSFRKCVNQILPLPEDMNVKHGGNKGGGGGKGHGGGRGGHGGGRGGRGRGRGGRGRY